MASGAAKVMVGSFKGTGAAIDVRTVGFRPRHVRVLNIGGLVTGEWIEGMADASAWKSLNHASAQNSFITSNGITPLSNGFTLGADTDLNVSGELCRYVAIE